MLSNGRIWATGIRSSRPPAMTCVTTLAPALATTTIPRPARLAVVIVLRIRSVLARPRTDIRAGTQSGSVITLRAQGAPRLRATGRGNLLVHVEVQTPTRLDAEQEELLQRLAELRGEERPEGRLTPNSHGLFGKLRSILNG